VMKCSTETLQNLDSTILCAARLGTVASVMVKARGTAYQADLVDAALYAVFYLP
jgi:hypothetical protein